ncbi:unnamed protein product [Closterium sp. NIES-54]
MVPPPPALDLSSASTTILVTLSPRSHELLLSETSALSLHQSIPRPLRINFTTKVYRPTSAMCQGQRLVGPAVSLEPIPSSSTIPHHTAVAAAELFEHLRCDPWSSPSSQSSPSSFLWYPNQLTTYHRPDTNAGGSSGCCTISRDDAPANANAAADAVAAAGAGTVATVTANTAAANFGPAKTSGLVGLADPGGSKREGSEAVATSVATAAAGAATLERGAKDHQSVAAAQAAVQAAQAEWPDRLLESWSSRAEDKGERWWRKASPQWGEISWSHCSARNGVCADTTGGGGGGRSVLLTSAGGSASGELLIDAVLAACNAGERERKLSAGEGTGEPQAARRAGAVVAGGASVPANSPAALPFSASVNTAGAAAAFPGMVPSLAEELEACVARRELAETAALAAGRRPQQLGVQQPFVSSSLAEVAAALERESGGGTHGCISGGGGGDVRPAAIAEGGGAAGSGGKRRRWCDVALALAGNGVNSAGAAAAAPVGAAADLWAWGSEKRGQQQRAASLEDQLEHLIQACQYQQQQQQQQAERQPLHTAPSPMAATAPCLISPSFAFTTSCPGAFSAAPSPSAPFPPSPPPACPCSGLCAAAPCCSGSLCVPAHQPWGLHRALEQQQQFQQLQQQQQQQQQLQKYQKMQQQQGGQWEGMGRWMSSLTGHAWLHQHQHHHHHYHHHHQQQQQQQQQQQRANLSRAASSHSLTTPFNPSSFPHLNAPRRPPMGAPEQTCFSSLFPVPVPSRRAQLPRARTSASAAAAAAGLRSGRGRGAAMAAASEKENKRIAAAALQWQLQQEKQQQEKQQQEKQQEPQVPPGMPATPGVQSVLPAAPRAPTESTAPAAAAPERVWRIDGRGYFPLWNDQQQQGVRRHKRFKLVGASSQSGASAGGSVTVGDKLSFAAAAAAAAPAHAADAAGAAAEAGTTGAAAVTAACGSGALDLQCTEVSILLLLRSLLSAVVTTAAATASALSCSADPACSSTTTSSSSMTIICVVVVTATATACAILLHLPMEAFPCLPRVPAWFESIQATKHRSCLDGFATTITITTAIITTTITTITTTTTMP